MDLLPAILLLTEYGVSLVKILGQHILMPAQDISKETLQQTDYRDLFVMPLHFHW